MEFDIIVTICPQERLKTIIDAARDAGATGATIIAVRGAGSKEVKTFFGLTLDRPQEACISVVERSKTTEIMRAIYNAGDMKEPGNGITFSLPVNGIMGFESQLGKIDPGES